MPRGQRLGWLLRFRWMASGMDSNWDTGPHRAWSEGEGEGEGEGSLITSHSCPQLRKGHTCREVIREEGYVQLPCRGLRGTRGPAQVPLGLSLSPAQGWPAGVGAERTLPADRARKAPHPTQGVDRCWILLPRGQPPADGDLGPPSAHVSPARPAVLTVGASRGSQPQNTTR